MQRVGSVFRFGVAAVVAFGLLAVSAASATTQALPETEQFIEQWNGVTWTQQPGAPIRGGSSLSAAVAFSPTDAWAVGSRVITTRQSKLHAYPVAEHWTGSSWQSVSVPAPKQALGVDLVGVAGSSSHDVWAVGYDGGKTLFEHWNGHSWRLRATSTTKRLEPAGVAVASPRAAWAVGASPDSKNLIRARIMRWNGSSWRRVRTPHRGADALFGVSARSARNVWAVGEYRQGRQTRTLVLHWNGSSWKRMPSPSPSSRGNSLRGVVAVGRKDVWAVGAYDTGKVQQPLAEHWDGRHWRVVPAPSAQPSSGFQMLNALAAVSSQDVWAVGDSGPGQAFSEHWDGSSWTVVPMADQAAFDGLSGVAAASTSRVWGVGLIDNP